MQISTAPTTEPVSSRLSPVEVWQILLKHLLAQHYGRKRTARAVWS